MTLSLDAVRQAALELATRRRAGQHGPRLADACRPVTLADALAIQREVSAHMGDAIGGWKCGTPSDERIVVAPIYQQTISSDESCAVWSAQGQVRVEPELAFVMAHDLPPRERAYDSAEVASAVARVHLALELIDSRYDEQAELAFPDRLADGLVNQGLWLGPSIPWAQAQAARQFPVQWSAGEGSPVTLSGQHPNDDPLAPLHWLVDHLRTTGQGLRAGQVVITGSYAGTFPCPLDQTLHFAYGDLGRFTVRFQARSN
ncbi:MAG: fumarylacetoacetate hydrolase family protein [Burkholderiales bacterium]|nr:fumarylacetoacetate hydrolase family protein [Burkholderiales bacterium]